MKENRKFLRQCICCRIYKSKQDLIRITKEFETDRTLINDNSKIYGRSVYLCKSSVCIKNAIKKKRIEYLLKSNLSELTKEKLIEYSKQFSD